MSAMRGRQGRELRRAKEIAAGVVPQLNARRRAAKERAAEAAATVGAHESSVATAATKNLEQTPDSNIAKKSGNKPSQKRTAGFASEHVPRVAVVAEEAEPEAAEDAGAGGLLVAADEADERLDQFLASRLEGVSRARVQLLISQDKVTLKAADGAAIAPAKIKASYKLSAGERVWVTGQVQLPPLRAVAEDIPLEILFEDADLAVVNKPAGMMVHAGAGHEVEDERGKGTMVNALLHHLTNLSQSEDELRPGVVHRLDRQTSGLLVVAKNDVAHQKLSEAFAQRETTKQYLALVQGRMKTDKGSINTPISRDVNRRTRMTTRRSDGRTALTHWKVKERLTTPWGEFSLLEVKIETGRTHQIRAHMSSIGHPVVGDTLYGAAAEIKQVPAARQKTTQKATGRTLQLKRNFLHAARLGLRHPRSGEWIEWEAPLPEELEAFLRQLREVE
jgi:23S rRNA pseudouridine1911/1915/1917 synthase